MSGPTGYSATSSARRSAERAAPTGRVRRSTFLVKAVAHDRELDVLLAALSDETVEVAAKSTAPLWAALPVRRVQTSPDAERDGNCHFEQAKAKEVQRHDNGCQLLR